MTQGTPLARFDLVGLPTQRSPEQTSPRGFSEFTEWHRGSSRAAHAHRRNVEQFHPRFQKTPAYTRACASDKKPPRIPVVSYLTAKDNLEGGQPSSLRDPNERKGALRSFSTYNSLAIDVQRKCRGKFLMVLDCLAPTIA